MFYNFDYSEKLYLNYINNPCKENYSFLEEDAIVFNNISSFYFTALVLYHGNGIEKKVSLAMVYLEELEKQISGNSVTDTRIFQAHELLAWIYESGELGNKYYEKAYSMYLVGVKSSNPKFSYERLGFLNYWGYGCEQNYPMAAVYFEKASSYGMPLSHCYLGTMIRDGEGVEKNIEKAVEHFEEAAKRENEDAISCLAYMYSEFYSEWETDFNKSVNYYEKLTQMDSPRAQRMGWYGIGYAYMESNDSEKYNFAINCLKKAAELGSEQAIELLNSL